QVAAVVIVEAQAVSGGHGHAARRIRQEEDVLGLGDDRIGDAGRDRRRAVCENALLAVGELCPACLVLVPSPPPPPRPSPPPAPVGHRAMRNCRTSERVTMPAMRSCDRTSTAGFDLVSSFTTLSSDCPDSTNGNGASITSLTVASRSFVFSSALADITPSLTEPTQLLPSITGSCDTSCRFMRRSAWRTVAPVPTDTTVGPWSGLAPRRSAMRTRSGASSWFSRIQSSL